MGFLVSPGVHVREIDLTNIVPAVATTIGAIAGPFAKGPVSEVTTVGSEQELVDIFGKPTAQILSGGLQLQFFCSIQTN